MLAVSSSVIGAEKRTAGKGAHFLSAGVATHQTWVHSEEAQKSPNTFSISGHTDESAALSQTSAATTAPAGLVISATFDRTITSNANAAAIEGAINRAIAIYQSLFSDRIRVSILFRYASTGATGTPLQQANISQSTWVYYAIPWESYIKALVTDATTTVIATDRKRYKP